MKQRPPLHIDMEIWNNVPHYTYLSQARGVVCYLAVDELGYSGDDVARSLRISGRGGERLPREGKENPLVPWNPILLLFNWYDKPEIIGEYLA